MANLSLKSVSKSFGEVEVIKSVDLEVEDGEFIVFVGPSGCGKSTVLRLLAGLESVSSGILLIDGADVTGMAPIDRGVAMVFQSYALYPHMTVRQNIGFGLMIAGMDKSAITQKVERAADILQLGPLLERKPNELSGGQRQRVAIGRAIVKEPKIFLFDEPLSNLDAELRVQMRLEIARLHTELGATMIYVTHDQVEAMTLASKIVVLRDGQIEQFGRPVDLYLDPDNEFVAAFIGSPRMNIVPGVAKGAHGDVVTATIDSVPNHELAVPVRSGSAVLPGAAIKIGFRPEHVKIEENALMSGVVSAIEKLGSVSFLYLTLADGSEITAEDRGLSAAQAGDTIEFSPDPDYLYLFDSSGARV